VIVKLFHLAYKGLKNFTTQRVEVQQSGF